MRVFETRRAAFLSPWQEQLGDLLRRKLFTRAVRDGIPAESNRGADRAKSAVPCGRVDLTWATLTYAPPKNRP